MLAAGLDGMSVGAYFRECSKLDSVPGLPKTGQHSEANLIPHVGQV